MISIRRPDDNDDEFLNRQVRRRLEFSMHPQMRKEIEKLARRSNISLESLVASILGDAVTQRKVISKKAAQTANSYAPKAGRKARAFICHASEDKPIARALHTELAKRDVDPWLDEENLFAGQDWDAAIQKVIHESDVILILLSKYSVSKKGYVQKEIRKALEVADLMPEGRIYVIPIRIDNGSLPGQLARWQAINYRQKDFYTKLLQGIQTAINTA